MGRMAHIDGRQWGSSGFTGPQACFYTHGMGEAFSRQVRFCTTRDDVNIAYATSGSGWPVVKTPNWMNHVELDAYSPVWRSWVERVNRHHTLVRYDARGCGLSDGDVAAEFGTNQLDLDAVVDSAGLHKFALFGACQGAAIAIEYAARHPDRVSHLILMGASLQGVFKRRPDAQSREEAEALLKLVEIGWGRENSAFRQIFATQFIPDSTPQHLLAFDEIQRKTVTPDRAAALLKSFYDIDVSEFAGHVRCPTIVFHATGDARVPFAEGRRTACTIPGAEFVSLESRNHIVLDHQPAWEQFFGEVESFLGRYPPDSAAAPLPRVADLTPAEGRVLDLLASGISNTEIANRLAISEKTVRNHINHIFSKLAVQNRSEAIVVARDAGYGRQPLRA